MSLYSGFSQNVAPLDGIRMDLMIYTWLKGSNGIFTVMELDRRYSARARKSGGRVSPTCVTCQVPKSFGPTSQRQDRTRVFLVQQSWLSSALMSLNQWKNLDCGVIKIGDSEGILIISRAFDQIQVFVQMLVGYFIKKFPEV